MSEAKKTKIIGFLNTYTSGVSGADVRFVEVMKRLNEDRCLEITVVTSKLGKDFCRDRGLNSKTIVTTSESNVVFGDVILLYVRRLLSVFRLIYPVDKNTVLYSSSDFLPDVFPGFFQKFKNKKCKWVSMIHLIAPNPFFQLNGSGEKVAIKLSKNALFYKMAQIVSIIMMKWWVDVIFVVNSDIRNYLLNFGIKQEKIVLVNNGIDVEKFNIAEFSENHHTFDACFVGRFHMQKGLFDLVNIWSMVCKEKPAAKLAIVGGGPEKLRSELEKAILAKRMVGNIKILGALNEAGKINVLHSSKMLIFPSTYESWGIVAAEAMACGLPVIAWNLPVYEKIFPQGMIKVPLGDVSVFSQEIIKLLENAELCSKIGKEASCVVSKYDWNIVANHELILLKGVLNNCCLQ
ncbi:MAG: glycosyltransferase family 4 protein [Nitrososphaerota archaeon]|jgi:glycosyltransferase involved in cell wall biosynthesis|nr:glycosyltransferase family 4 protein [Nitrososphaerota archaeon]